MEDFRSEITMNIEKESFNSDMMIDPNINYTILENIIKSAHEKHFPLKEVRFNKYKHKIAPWITYGILNSMKFRDKLYVKWKKSDPSTLNYQLQENSFKSYCSILQKTVRLAKSQYYFNKFQHYKTDMKKTWKQINEIMQKKKKTPDLPKYFLDNNKVITENIDIANCFNNFFSNIGPTLANAISSPPNKSFRDYLTPSITSSFNFNMVTEEDTFKVINNSKSKTRFKQ